MKLITILVLMLALFGCSSFNNNVVEKTVTEYGYTYSQAASNLFEPGAIVLIKQENPFNGTMICDQKDSLGMNLKVNESKTYETTHIENIHEDYEVDLDAIGNEIKIDIKDSIKIEKRFRNVKVKEITDAEIVKRIDKNNRAESCQRIIDHRLNLGDKVTLIKSVIQADVVYEVKFYKNFSSDIKLKILNNLQGKVNGKKINSKESSIDGDNLYWGIKHDPGLATIKAFKKQSSNSFNNNEIIPFFKSMILPGWGQFSKREYIKGTFFFAAIAAAGVNANNTINTYKQYQRDYGTPELNFFTSYMLSDSYASLARTNLSQGNYSSFYTNSDLSFFFKLQAVLGSSTIAEKNSKFENDINTFTAIAGGIYFINILDALLPSSSETNRYIGSGFYFYPILSSSSLFNSQISNNDYRFGYRAFF